MARRRNPVQLELPLRRHGGARAGAGRKRGPGRPGVVHRARPAHSRSHPVHVTLRAHRLTPWLRSQRVFERIRACIGKASKGSFRVVHYSVQGNHVHLLVEATERTALSRGIHGLSIRIARQVNGLVGRRGAFWGDRYHARPLRTPREVRHGLVYVLMNHKKHARGPAPDLDPCSSAASFEGLRSSLPRTHDPSVVTAKTWLARVGWRRHGRIALTERPT